MSCGYPQGCCADDYETFAGTDCEDELCDLCGEQLDEDGICTDCAECDDDEEDEA